MERGSVAFAHVEPNKAMHPTNNGLHQSENKERVVSSRMTEAPWTRSLAGSQGAIGKGMEWTRFYLLIRVPAYPLVDA